MATDNSVGVWEAVWRETKANWRLLFPEEQAALLFSSNPLLCRNVGFILPDLIFLKKKLEI